MSRTLDFTLDTEMDGSFHELFNGIREDPESTTVRVMDMPATVVARYEDIKLFLGDHRTQPGGAIYQMTLEPAIGPTFISMEDDQHNLYRKLVTPTFRSRPATRFVDEQLATLAHEIVDGFADRGQVDLVEAFTGVLPFSSISRKVGFPPGDEDDQRSAARTLLTYMVTPEAAVRAAGKVTALVEPLLDLRRETPADDVLSQLVNADVDGQSLTDAETLSHLRLLYAVGATTTADEMSNLFHHLLSRPELVARARREPELRPRIIHEALRYEPPVAILPRLVTSSGIVAGRPVEPGMILMVAISAGNRDPRVFTDPEVFDPDREEETVLSFGFGAKFCPGAHFARRQLLVALDAMLDRLPGLRLVESSGPTGMFLRSTKKLVVAWDV